MNLVPAIASFLLFSAAVHGIDQPNTHRRDQAVDDDDASLGFSDDDDFVEDADFDFREGDDVEFLGADEFRIVGGSNAPAGRFPYMVRGGGCGGSLVAPDMVLTAAHCSGTFGGTLRIGSIDRNSGGVTARMRYEIKHPNYKGSNNDFMLLKLDREVNKKTIKLNGKANSPTVNEPLTVIGFGRTSEGGSSSNRLKQVKVPYVSHEKCRSVYGNTIRKETMLCAG